LSRLRTLSHSGSLDLFGITPAAYAEQIKDARDPA
jgi:hypothetical protein